MKGISGIFAAGQAPECRYAERNPKFRAEKVCAEDKRYLIHLDGVLLGNAEAGNGRFEWLCGLYEQYGTAMTAHLKGQFNLVVVDKQKGKALVTNDLLSRRPLYYCALPGRLVYAASYRDLLDLLRDESGFVPAVDAGAVERMAFGGALGGAQTYLSGVNYLDACQTLWVDADKGEAEVVSVPFESSRKAASMEEAVAVFDELFTKAVQAQFEKNIQYGYDHRVALSGGMDSRACLLKAVACGYDREITCFNYAQAGSIDHQVSQQIAYDNRLDYLFYPMDTAVFMNRMADAHACNECQQSGIGSTGARTMARMMDQSRTGIVHVGLCGGELMGDLVKVQSSQGRIRRILTRLGLAGDENAQYAFNLREYLDNLRACQNFSQMYLDCCETVSPFMDEDVVRFVTGLDPKLLYRRNLYREWMKKHIPNKYPTTYFCGPVDISPVREVLAKIADAAVRRVAGASKRDMNPMDRWLKTQPHLEAAMQAEYRTGLELLGRAGMAQDVMDAVQKGWEADAEHRLYTLTAVSALREIAVLFSQK